jgi:hypothetical protein
MPAVRWLALGLSTALVGVGCAQGGDAVLSGGTVTTTTTVATTVATTSTTAGLALPTTAPRPTDAPPPPSTDVTEPPATTTTTAPTTTTTTRPPVLAGPVTYSIRGGIGDVRDELMIGPSGAANFQSGLKSVDFTVAGAQLMRLEAALDEANFPTLDSVYGIATLGGFEYRVSYQGKSVLIFGSSEPSRLKPALMILSQEMERARAL